MLKCSSKTRNSRHNDPRCNVFRKSRILLSINRSTKLQKTKELKYEPQGRNPRFPSKHREHGAWHKKGPELDLAGCCLKLESLCKMSYVDREFNAFDFNFAMSRSALHESLEALQNIFLNQKSNHLAYKFD